MNMLNQPESCATEKSRKLSFDRPEDFIIPLWTTWWGFTPLEAIHLPETFKGKVGECFEKNAAFIPATSS